MVLQIRLERVARGLRSYELAGMLKCDPQVWYGYEAGTKPVSARVADNASALFGKPASELFKPVEVEAIAI